VILWHLVTSSQFSEAAYCILLQVKRVKTRKDVYRYNEMRKGHYPEKNAKKDSGNRRGNAPKKPEGKQQKMCFLRRKRRKINVFRDRRFLRREGD
jgi:hypothetical protein